MSFGMDIKCPKCNSFHSVEVEGFCKVVGKLYRDMVSNKLLMKDMSYGAAEPKRIFCVQCNHEWKSIQELEKDIKKAAE